MMQTVVQKATKTYYISMDYFGFLDVLSTIHGEVFFNKMRRSLPV